MTGLYVHIPFCASKCAYCDFNSHVGLERLIPRYTQALKRELGVWSRLVSMQPEPAAVSTVYFGGGTPTLLGAQRLVELLCLVEDSFAVLPGAEVTVETNPGATVRAGLALLALGGFNRLSIGVQSLDDRELRLIGRTHSAGEAALAVQAARKAGFSNVNLDLMYGLPGQRLETWRASLAGALDRSPEHVSLYALSLEPGTPLAEAVAAGQVPPPDPDAAADMYDLAEELLKQAGYRHYEISNWALPGRECRHNVSCWRDQDYIGAGAGAHSYMWSCRLANTASPTAYTERMESLPGGPADGPTETTDKDLRLLQRSGLPLDSLEHIDRKTAMAETMMLGLRLEEGVDCEQFKGRFGVNPVEVYGRHIAELQGMGLLAVDGASVRLTPRGRLLGNRVFSCFVA